MIDRLIHLTLLFVIILDPLGNVPLFVSALRHLPPRRQSVVIIREMSIALAIMILFFFFGSGFFHLLSVDEYSLEITGGVILFLIALSMLFSKPREERKSVARDPLIVPLAIPAIAGPAILAAITVYGAGIEEQRVIVFLAILIAWLITLPVVLLSPLLKKWIGDNGLLAIEHLFGYLLVLISIQMMLHGLVGAFS